MKKEMLLFNQLSKDNQVELINRSLKFFEDREEYDKCESIYNCLKFSNAVDYSVIDKYIYKLAIIIDQTITDHIEMKNELYKLYNYQFGCQL